MEFKSINPYNGEEVGAFTALSSSELNRKLALSQTAFNSWKKTSFF